MVGHILVAPRHIGISPIVQGISEYLVLPVGIGIVTTLPEFEQSREVADGAIIGAGLDDHVKIVLGAQDIYIALHLIDSYLGGERNP